MQTKFRIFFRDHIDQLIPPVPRLSIKPGIGTVNLVPKLVHLLQDDRLQIILDGFVS